MRRPSRPLVLLPLAACTVAYAEPRSDAIETRIGKHTITSVLRTDDVIESTIVADGEPVAWVELADGRGELVLAREDAEPITLEVSSASLDRVNDHVGQAYDVLTSVVPEDATQSAGCSWEAYPSLDGFCVYSSCPGGCWALDCVYGDGDSIHMSGDCGIT